MHLFEKYTFDIILLIIWHYTYFIYLVSFISFLQQRFVAYTVLLNDLTGILDEGYKILGNLSCSNLRRQKWTIIVTLRFKFNMDAVKKL